MTLSTQSSSSASPSSFNSCGDSVDIDSFLNFDPTLYPSPARSPVVNRSKSAVGQHPTLSSSSSYASTQSSQSQTFSGPSHQYEQYKQQTGLPLGGLANTLAFNENSMAFGGINSGFVMPSESFFDTGLGNDMYKFNSFDGRHLSVGDGTELDLDMDSPSNESLPPYFYPNVKNEFVDPNALGGQEEPPSSQNNVTRMYPGMHQQAALAKAQQEKQQQEMLRQQQQQKQMEAQRAQSQPRAHPPTDPVVEERISRLLQQMRKSSSAGSPDDEASTPTAHNQLSKLKKEEDDMDEDERLLASEEGKKLSSKERRQLRNKVSARAFRSRRKGTLSQAML